MALLRNVFLAIVICIGCLYTGNLHILQHIFSEMPAEPRHHAQRG